MEIVRLHTRSLKHLCGVVSDLNERSSSLEDKIAALEPPPDEVKEQPDDIDPTTWVIRNGVRYCRYHPFRGRADRWCDLCNLPDRHSIHNYTHPEGGFIGSLLVFLIGLTVLIVGIVLWVSLQVMRAIL